ncbi:MAG: hypothetical protein FJ202_08285 [Gemmatimonadetes bacterium]|nr:hypothetical protein [Gemmatimonadota bacterium]
MSAPTTHADQITSLDELRQRGEAFLEDVSGEYHAAYAGLKPGAELQPIYHRHASTYGDGALATVRQAFASAKPGTDDDRSARLLLDWVIGSQIGRTLAPLEEREIGWEVNATIALPDGGAEPYQRAAITIANATDAEARNGLDRARAALVGAELAPLKQERLQRERDLVEAAGVAPGYIAAFEALAGISLSGLRAQCEAFLRDTQGMWNDSCPWFLRERLGMASAEPTRADALALFRAREFDAAFPGDAMEREVRRQVTEMGASPDAHGRVRYDTGDRPGKRARAFCSPVRIPDEVHLVLRPHGGQNDWQTLLHELGHALHFGNAERALPFEYRWLGDNSVTEGYAMLFDHRMKSPGWLARYTGLGKSDMPGFMRSGAFEELHFLRRYCGKLIYEMELYGGRVGWDKLPDIYVETLWGATGFRYQRADAFVDVDPGFYSSRYLRAWQLQALLDETLTERFNDDWWRNPAAGPWIVGELFGHGQRELADEQAQRVSGKPLGFAPLIRAIERAL